VFFNPDGDIKHRDWRKYHLAHHYKTFELGYGVTSKFWDTIFGTLTHLHGAKEANDRDGVGFGAENQECGIGCRGGGVHWLELFRQKGKFV
jgi:sterol desaturase/sphingolipid hydroxylase (fatty acid hydroxylase superfamily)